MKPLIIGLAGPIGVGKSHIADEIRHIFLRAGKTPLGLSFATPIKEMMTTLMRQRGMSELEAETWVHKRDHRDIPCLALNGHTMRHALQTLGTEWGRDCLGDDFWAEFTVQKALMAKAYAVVIDDCRFETELNAIQKAGGVVVELQREGIEYPEGHRSEGALSGKVPAFENNEHPGVVASNLLRTLEIIP